METLCHAHASVRQPCRHIHNLKITQSSIYHNYHNYRFKIFCSQAHRLIRPFVKLNSSVRSSSPSQSLRRYS